MLPRARASFTPSDAFHTCCPLYGRPAWCRVYGMLPPPPPYALPRPADSWLPQNRHPDMVERLMLLCPAGLPVRGYSANTYMTLIHSAKSLLELPFVGESVTKYVLLRCRYPWPGFGVHATACGHNGPAWCSVPRTQSAHAASAGAGASGGAAGHEQAIPELQHAVPNPPRPQPRHHRARRARVRRQVHRDAGYDRQGVYSCTLVTTACRGRADASTCGSCGFVRASPFSRSTTLTSGAQYVSASATWTCLEIGRPRSSAWERCMSVCQCLCAGATRMRFVKPRTHTHSDRGGSHPLVCLTLVGACDHPVPSLQELRCPASTCHASRTIRVFQRHGPLLVLESVRGALMVVGARTAACRNVMSRCCGVCAQAGRLFGGASWIHTRHDRECWSGWGSHYTHDPASVLRRCRVTRTADFRLTWRGHRW